MNYSNSQRAGVILNLAALLFGGYAAIDKQKPMTMELFSSCLAKCTEHGPYKLFERLLDEYPELSDKYVKVIEDDIKDVLLLERTPEEEEESWN